MTLLASHNFDESSGDILDVSGNGHSFPLGSGTRVAGDSGHGSALTSSAVLAGPALFGQTPQRTLMMRITMPASTPIAFWAYEWYQSSGDTGVWGLLWLNGSVGFRARDASGTPSFAAVSPPTDGLSHHFAGTCDGTTVRLYVDGVLAATGPTSLSGTFATADSLRAIDPVGAAPIIDDARIYDTVLDAATIAALQNVPVAPEAPSEDHSGAATITGAGSLTFGTSLTASGALPASGGGTLSLSGRPAFSRALSLSGEGSQTTDAAPHLAAELPTAGTGALDASAALALTADLQIYGDGSLSSASAVAASGALALSGSGDLVPAPYVEPGYVDLSLSASTAGNRWSGAARSGRWSATGAPNPLNGAVES